MTGQEFPANLFFDARDRAELRPAEYFHTAKATHAEQAAAALKLRDELERRSRVVSRAVQDVERLRRGKPRKGVAARLNEIALHCAALPDYDTRSPDEIIGYAEHGMW